MFSENDLKPFENFLKIYFCVSLFLNLLGAWQLADILIWLFKHHIEIVIK